MTELLSATVFFLVVIVPLNFTGTVEVDSDIGDLEFHFVEECDDSVNGLDCDFDIAWVRDNNEYEMWFVSPMFVELGEYGYEARYLACNHESYHRYHDFDYEEDHLNISQNIYEFPDTIRYSECDILK